MKIPADAIDTTSPFIMDGNMLHDVDSEEPYFEDCEYYKEVIFNVYGHGIYQKQCCM